MKIENKKIYATEENEFIKRKYDEIMICNLFKTISLGINEDIDNFMSIIISKEEYQELLNEEMKEEMKEDEF